MRTADCRLRTEDYAGITSLRPPEADQRALTSVELTGEWDTVDCAVAEGIADAVRTEDWIRGLRLRLRGIASLRPPETDQRVLSE
jgi:hypothetical protein